MTRMMVFSRTVTGPFAGAWTCGVGEDCVTSREDDSCGEADCSPGSADAVPEVDNGTGGAACASAAAEDSRATTIQIKESERCRWSIGVQQQI
jgi:hypothetical protein